MVHGDWHKSAIVRKIYPKPRIWSAHKSGKVHIIAVTCQYGLKKFGVNVWNAIGSVVHLV